MVIKNFICNIHRTFAPVYIIRLPFMHYAFGADG